jgi:NTE family protein
VPLTLSAVVASGTLPAIREAEHIKGEGHYWDGLYSQNPPVREFFSKVSDKEKKPDEWPETPKINKDIQDRQNELMGNLSLNKDLGFIQQVNEWRMSHGDKFGNHYKHVTVRTIKMKKVTADNLQYSSKFDRSREFMDQLRKEGHAVARDWLDHWPDNVGCYPEDAAYR